MASSITSKNNIAIRNHLALIDWWQQPRCAQRTLQLLSGIVSHIKTFKLPKVLKLLNFFTEELVQCHRDSLTQMQMMIHFPFPLFESFLFSPSKLCFSYKIGIDKWLIHTYMYSIVHKNATILKWSSINNQLFSVDKCSMNSENIFGHEIFATLLAIVRKTFNVSLNMFVHAAFVQRFFIANLTNKNSIRFVNKLIFLL